MLRILAAIIGILVADMAREYIQRRIADFKQQIALPPPSGIRGEVHSKRTKAHTSSGAGLPSNLEEIVSRRVEDELAKFGLTTGGVSEWDDIDGAEPGRPTVDDSESSVQDAAFEEEE
jgi:hypothetical protein